MDWASEWGRIVRAYRDYLEDIIRGIHGQEVKTWGNKNLVGYTTWQLMGLSSGEVLLERAHAHMIKCYAPKRMWSDPVI